MQGLIFGISRLCLAFDHEFQQQITFSQFKVMVESLPKNRLEFNENSQRPDPFKDSAFVQVHPEDKDKQRSMLSDEIEKFQKIQRQEKNKSDDWLTSNEGLKQSSVVGLPSADRTFEPFAEKIVAKLGEEYILHGDLHGDIISLVTQLNDLYKAGKMDDNFTLKPGVNLMFLGDYVDRGNYGSEVWYALMRLANANPKQVTLVRGNHEDCKMTDRHGFKKELCAKFGEDPKTDVLYDLISKTHELMPVVVYLGNQQGKFLQLCHGGIESGYNPGRLLDSNKDHAYEQLGVLNRKSCYDAIIKDPASSDMLKLSMQAQSGYLHDGVKLRSPMGNSVDPTLGFMWNDFVCDDSIDTPIAYSKIRHGFGYGKEGTQATLKQQGTQKSEIVGIVRAHQHTSNPNDLMMQKIIAGKGVARFWGSQKADAVDGVMTMNVAPDSGYGQGIGFDYDTSMGVSTDEKGTWSRRIYNHQPLVKDPTIENPYTAKLTA